MSLDFSFHIMEKYVCESWLLLLLGLLMFPVDFCLRVIC